MIFKMPGIVLFCFVIQFVNNLCPGLIQIHLTAEAHIADSVDDMKGKVIRALAVHVKVEILHLSSFIPLINPVALCSTHRLLSLRNNRMAVQCIVDLRMNL